jgi:chorismate mutase
MGNSNKTFNVVPLKEWFTGQQHPFIISGPCSAESREQVLTTAAQLHQTGLVSVFRSGIWKPRTRPNEFEGHGAPALAWLTEVREMYGFPLAVEVATPKHVEACLKAGIDILWVGARTSVNPFSIQELSEALRGVSIPVMIKNPLSPDLSLWIGVIERFFNSGINKIAAIHRGFKTYNNGRYRNEPLWEIPVKLKSLFPTLPIICDPSHIGGQTNLLREIMQRALLLDVDGFMIESHCNPHTALTDAAQQIRPVELTALINNLKMPVASDQNPCNELEMLRNTIDEYDTTLIDLLAKRMKVVKDIAKIKKECKMTVLQINRWNEIVESRTREGAEKGLGKDFLRNLLDLVHKESIEIQSKIIS